MFKGNNKNTKMTSMMSFWCFYCSLRTYFTPFFSVSIVDFEQVNVSWERINFLSGSITNQGKYQKIQ